LRSFALEAAIKDLRRLIRLMCTLFVLSSQYVLFMNCGSGLLRCQVAQFEGISGLV
jgi:hypothetical protein